MDRRASLLDARALLGASLRESERWEESYTQDPASFKSLLKQEQVLNRAVAEYLYGLAMERASGFINWSDVRPKLSADTVLPLSDELWKQERDDLVVIVEPIIELLAGVGVAAGEAIYKVPVDYTDLSDAVYRAAKHHTAELVTNVTKTTRKLIRQTVEKSIRSGEKVDELIVRLRGIINNPVRAEMIAYTESVNAYQIGMRQFAVETGAISKTWESKLQACPRCAPLDEKTIPIDDEFVLPDGRAVSQPTAHVRCRCGCRYNYPQNP